MGNPFWDQLCAAVFSEPAAPYGVTGEGRLPSVYKTSDFAEATIGLAGTAFARLQGGAVAVDRRFASLWFDMTLRPIGWQVPSLWDAVAGNYACKDGWIRLHTSAPHHRVAALSVLHVPAERAAVAEVIAGWNGAELECAVVAANGCAAQMRSAEDWGEHPQGRAVAAEPLVHWEDHGECAPDARAGLRGTKVLDLTRVLAGPVATRFLAGFGAQVLRIDPPSWNETSVEMEVTLGKRCAGLDLKQSRDLARLKVLLREADVFVHGYRADALERLGLGDGVRRALNPNLIDVRLNAYGWGGPWRERRGFDSLVQMSCGIAVHGMLEAGADKPVPLPVQALDHGTGYLMAACVLEALAQRRAGRVRSAKVSLARTAHLLMQHPCAQVESGAIVLAASDSSARIEATGWGDAHRIKVPLKVGGQGPVWALPARPLRGDPAQFS
ncbi:CoA transferase [Planktotalea arctica]|uniref:CoA transferase n=1 Tax=Planktotalea arctica TaxID=1481893 RepID=UPI000A1700D8|nr:CoA transferase [Planktotalea arctica]